MKLKGGQSRNFQAIQSGDIRAHPNSDALCIGRICIGQVITSSDCITDKYGRKWIRFEADACFNEDKRKQNKDEELEISAACWTALTKKNGTPKFRLLIEEGLKRGQRLPGMNTTTRKNNDVVRLIIVRHGERIDETIDAHEFYSCSSRERFWDPWLTKTGMQQGLNAGRQLMQQLEQFQDLKLHHHIVTSPCLRTVQTAAAISIGLGGLPIQCFPGVGECASAIKKRGIQSFDPNSNGPHLFLTTQELAQYCPPSTKFLESDSIYDEFMPCLHRIAVSRTKDHQSGHQDTKKKAIIIVTHREGIRELCHRVGHYRMRTNYCEIVHFDLDIKSLQLSMY